MGPKDILELLQPILAPVSRLFSAIRREVRLQLFRMRDKNPPIDEVAAMQLSASVLSGHIDRAIAYRNIDSDHIFIAVARRESQSEYASQVYILEQFGNTYRSIWSSEDLWSNAGLYVDDINRDGNKEVVFTQESFGTGGGAREMLVYSIARNQLCRISEIYNWQDAAGPVSPRIEIDDCPDKRFLRAVEKYAVGLRFLQGKPIDLGKPDFAMQAWHADNGRRRSGRVLLRFYPGRPTNFGSVTASLKIDGLLWTAYFKGPICGYLAAEDRHFVAYSPEWKYNWATCLAHDGRSLWFGIHSDVGLLSFELTGDTGFLHYFSRVHNLELPEVNSVHCSDGRLFINESLRFRVDELIEDRSWRA
jgi:hypothetical protein